jgi:hypothetical protein
MLIGLGLESRLWSKRYLYRSGRRLRAELDRMERIERQRSCRSPSEKDARRSSKLLSNVKEDGL